MYELGIFIGGACAGVGCFVGGWIAHNHFVHKPTVRRMMAEHSSERAADRRRIGEMAERAREIETAVNEHERGA